MNGCRVDDSMTCHSSFLMTSNKTNPLPFSDTLRDLALLRASDVDFASILSSLDAESNSSATSSTTTEVAGDVQTSVQRSYEFVHEARAALKILNRNDVDRQGIRVDDVRGKLEDVLEGLRGEPEL